MSYRDLCEFPGHDALMALNRRKLARFTPQMLYMSRPTTLLHSLEAFTSRIDFDRLAHHLSGGAMLNSPSSTAAYLIYRSDWDDEAEAYLRFVILSTLLESGFSTDQLGQTSIEKLTGFMEEILDERDGVCGFAPGILPDADDTAKSIFSLNSAGRAVGCDKLIETFNAQKHFKTYDLEVTHSFSVNCNVLKAMLVAGDVIGHLDHIFTVLRYLCQNWHNGQNLRPQYSMMLLGEAFALFLRRWDQAGYIDVPADLMSEHGIVSVVTQIVTRTLSSQSATDSSWDFSTEVTAYALLTLKKLSSLPWPEGLGTRINAAINAGTQFLREHESDWDRPSHIWIEKVSYGSGALSLTYCLAALAAKDV
ncbi:terpenoid cyclases/Protein prenyltransferase [Aspergillus affinis]|uniref:terpenoid cyclases/Protein prenyltransferase n=1 Tax=Aspergillus affinis TaxID=1070780 RepID=UPI0022FE727C|nr:terpenoid cyclases/Protein prenyltransferase [Aspergillus affinis]KAI9041321.1 terpenoid cyclases/Protein prenyltransferase [Aspergillus affinis]